MKLAFERKVEEWKERKDTCISIIYECASNNGEALEIVDQYVLENEKILPANDANKESLASELTTPRLVNRFRGELEDEIADFSSQFTNFKMIPEEKVEKGVDRFNGIVQKLNRHNRGLTADAKKAKLRESLEIPELESLWVAISMLDNPSFETIVASCRRYDKVSKKKGVLNGGEIHFTATTEKSGKKGHHEHTRNQFNGKKQ